MFKVLDASGQALVYVYARETKAQADITKVLTFDEARRASRCDLTEKSTRTEHEAKDTPCSAQADLP